MADSGLPRTTSASQLVSYTMCPRKYAFQYVLGIEPEFTSTALILGSVVHSGIGWWFEERLQDRSPAIEDALEIVTADLTAAIVDERIHWKERSPESLEAQAYDLVRTYLAEHGELPVAAVEQPFEVGIENPEETDQCGPRPLKGYFDLVLRDHTVIEIKTSSSAWPEAYIERHLQVGAYAFAWNTLHGGPSQVDLHLLVKNKKPRVDTHTIARGEPATRWWFHAAISIEEAIIGGHFPPSPGPLCVQCEYQRTCARWGAEQTKLSVPTSRSLPIVHDTGAPLFAF